MKALLLALLLPAVANAGPHAKLPIDEVYVMVCKNAEGVYFIRPTGVLYSMQGLNGAPNCIGAKDTAGHDHVLCKVENSPDICDLAKPGPAI